MPVRRVPGPLGLWPDQHDPFPVAGGPWECAQPATAIPSGAAEDALELTGPVGLTSEHHVDRLGHSEEVEPASKPIERFRYMEIQGEVVKVRCVPLWQDRFEGMLEGSDEDDKAQEALVKAIKGHPGSRRAEICAFCKDTLANEGRAGGPTASRISEIKISKAAQAEQAELSEGEGALPAVQRLDPPGRLTSKSLPAVQRGRSLVNG
jgi:hypothetical protein